MVFGDKKTFAIEATFLQQKQYLFIQYCFWVSNQKVGDNTQKCLLNLELENFEHNIRMKNNRRIKEPEQFDYKDFYDFLNFELWGVGSGNDKIKGFKNASFLSVIKDYGECFDGYFCYLLEFESYDMFIWNNLEDKVMCSKIPKNQFYTAFKKISDWIKSNTRLVLVDEVLQSHKQI